MNNKYKHHPPTSDAIIQAHESIRRWCSEFEDAIKMLVPASREQSVAITKLEEVMFWANAGIARNQIDTNT